MYFSGHFMTITCCEVIFKRRYNDNDIMTTNKLPGMYFFLNYRYFQQEIKQHRTVK
jgi:hypothetical protein